MNDSEKDKILIEIHGNVNSIMKMVEEHQKALFGNGQPGLIKEHERLVTEFNHLSSSVDELEDKTNENSHRIGELEKEHAVAKGKLDTWKATWLFILSYLASLASLIMGVLKL